MQVNNSNEFFTLLLRVEKLENEKYHVFRSFPPHMNSALPNQPSRTYGGTTVCYAFLAAQLFYGKKLDSISLFYLRPGSCELPLDIRVNTLSHDKLFVEVMQEGRILARAYAKEMSMTRFAITEYDRKIVEESVKSPDFYDDDDRNYREQISKIARKERRDVYGSPLDVRFVDYGSVHGSRETSLIWVRIPPSQREHFKSKNISQNGLAVYLSDYFMCQPAAISLRNNGRYFTALNTLNHNVNVVQHDFDPFQWFLLQSSLASMSNDRSIFRYVIWSEMKSVIAFGSQECFTPSRIVNKL